MKKVSIAADLFIEVEMLAYYCLMILWLNVWP